MAKTLYYAHEVRELLNNKIADLKIAALEGDKTDEEILNSVKEIRTFKKFVDMISEDLRKGEEDG